MELTETRARTGTRAQLLAAAPVVWSELEPAELFGGLTAARIARAAGVTRATFYAYFPTVGSYVDELLAALGSDRSPRGRTLGAPPLGPSTHSVHGLVVQECERALGHLLGEPDLPIRLGMLSRSGDPAVAAVLRQRYRDRDQAAEARYQGARESWGREIRPPFTHTQAQAVYTAVTEGLALRRLVDPEVVPPGLCGRIVLALTMFVTRRVDDPRTVDEMLDTADAWPAVGLRLRSRSDRGLEPFGPRIDTAMARRVTQEARRLLGSMGWHDLDLGDIAAAMGLSEEHLLGAFGSKAGLGMAIQMLSLGDRLASFPRTGDPAVDLCRMVATGVEELRRAPAVTLNSAQVVLGTSAAPAAGTVDWNPMHLLVEQIRAVRDAGLLRAELEPDHFAVVLARTVLLECAAGEGRPSGHPSAVELLLVGAGLDPVAAAAPSTATVPDGGSTERAEPAADVFPA